MPRSLAFQDFMFLGYLLLWVIGIPSLWRIWRANRHTSIIHAVFWGFAGWVAWAIALSVGDYVPLEFRSAMKYVALCLTGCSSVAVLGARRPGVGPWNLVVLALLAVNLLPLAEGVASGRGLQLGGLRLACVGGTIAVGILNYLPTRGALPALLLLLVCAPEFLRLVFPESLELRSVVEWWPWKLVIFTLPWVGYRWMAGRTKPARALDRLWLEFRDRFGFVWGERLREQFNRSAAHRGWPVTLRWQGLQVAAGDGTLNQRAEEAMTGTLRALMMRFGMNNEE